MSTLGSLRVSSAQLSMPQYGSARADVLFEGGAVPTVGPATLTLADLAMVGTVILADLDAPDLPRAVWVNGAAWDLPLPGRSYASDAGVKLSTVLRDLIADVNAAATVASYAPESFAALPTDVLIGSLYMRPESTPTTPSAGRAVLAELHLSGLIPSWWIDSAGAMHFDARPTTGATSPPRADIMRRNAAMGLRVFGLDSPASFLPGTSVEGVVTARLVVRETSGSLTAEAWSGKPRTIRASLARIAATTRPEAAYAYPRTYVVRAVHADGRLDLTPPPTSPDLKPLDSVEQWTLTGTLSVPAVGDSVAVTFLDAMPTRAKVIGFAPPTTPGPGVARVSDVAGFEYLEVVPGGGGVSAVALYRSPQNGATSSWSLVASGAIPPVNGVTSGTPVTITTGSAKVFAQ